MHVQPVDHKPFQLRDFADFSVPEPAAAAEAIPELPPEPPAPTFSEQELLAAQKEAHAAGYEAGKAAAQALIDKEAAQREAQLASLIRQMLSHIGIHSANIEVGQAEQKREMASLVLMVVRKLTGRLLKEFPLAAIEGMLDDCLQMLAGEERVTIIVHPDVTMLLEERLQSTSHDGPVIQVKGDNAMQLGDCRVEWPEGKAKRDQQALWNEIEGIVTRALGPVGEKNNGE